MERGRYIFTSDLHLGADKYSASQGDFVSFLDNLPGDTRALYLLGDIFDFWFERKRRPTGFDDILDALKRVVDGGVEVFFLKGNHDWWTFGRLEQRTGIKILEPQPVRLVLAGKRFCIAHGDALGPMDWRMRLTRSLLKGKLSIFLARYLVPERLLYRLAKIWSSSSRHTHELNPYIFDTENPLYKFACDEEKSRPADYFIFGHIHRPVDISTPGGAGLHLTDDWSDGPNWLEFDGKSITRVISKPGLSSEGQVCESEHLSKSLTSQSEACPQQEPVARIGKSSISTALSSLRSDGCWGSGDLGCLKPLADIAASLGIGQIEITDIRDSAAEESSIYPAFIDLRPMGTLSNRSKDAEYRQRAAGLEALPDVDISKVYNAKMHFLHEKFLMEGGETLSGDTYHAFWKANRSWLETYTVFCTLRHKYGTGDNRFWAEPDYQRLLTDVNFIKEYSADLRFHLYAQYILHMQWEDARAYAAQKGVELSAHRGSSAPSLRQWWSGLDQHARKEYYNNTLGLPGQAPECLSGWEMEAVIRHKLSESSGEQTLPLRDWLGITRLEEGDTSRMAVTLEDILAHKALLDQIRKAIEAPDK